MKKQLKKLLSIFLAALLCFGVLPGTASAAGFEYEGYLSMIEYPGRGNSLSDDLPAPFGGHHSELFTEMRINDLRAFRTAYCIQLGVQAYSGVGYDSADDYDALTQEQKELLNTALTLGYNVETGTKYGGVVADEYLATQILIWLILNAFFHTAQKNGIPVSISADTSETSPVADMDFVAILSNILENALNGCKMSGSHGEIRVNIRTVADKTVIVCSNPCKADLVIENNMLQSRGTGINSIVLAARKYGGDIRYELESGNLTVCIILNA